jgi:hypothetical protein
MNLTRRSLLASLVALVSLVLSPAAPVARADAPAASQPRRAMRVLFIGNSYTFYNGSLPAIVQAMAKARGRDVECVPCVSGGKSLEWHWNQGKARQALADGPWDVVVLQDFSRQAIDKPRLLDEYGRKFAAEIKKAGAKPVFFMTWARQHQPEMQQVIADAYEKVAAEANATVAPVGLAWQRALKQDPTLKLHQADKSHPTKAGSYLAACVFYDVLFGVDVELPSSIDLGKVKIDLPPEQARSLQRIASEVSTSPATHPNAER